MSPSTFQLSGYYSPIVVAPILRTDNVSFELALADRLYKYPAQRSLPTEGLSAAFVYRSLKTKCGVVVVELPNASLQDFCCTVREVELAADALVRELSRNCGLLSCLYSFDGTALKEIPY
jgi:hypothetical protein